MEWISVKDQKPDPSLKRILVWGKCGCCHIVGYDYDEWCHIEFCSDEVTHLGPTVNFDYWQCVPESPGE